MTEKARRWTTVTLKPVPRSEAERRLDAATASGPDRPVGATVAEMPGAPS